MGYVSVDNRAIVKYLSALLLVMIGMFLFGGIGFALVIPFALFALLTAKQISLYFYLMLAIAMMMGNQILMPKDAIFAISQRALLMTIGAILSVRIVGRPNSPILKSLKWICPYLIFMVFSSYFGWNPIISFLKLILFSFVFFAYYGVSNSIALSCTANEPKIRAIILAFSSFFIIGSVILIPFPSLGQLSGAEYLEMVQSGNYMPSLFKGMTMHSQSLGPSVAMIATVLLGDYIFSIRRVNWLYLSLLFAAPVLIYYSSSRTAAGGFLIGVAAILCFGLHYRWLDVSYKRKIFGATILMATIVCILLLFSSTFMGKIKTFSLKFREVGDSDEVGLEEMLRTREGKWDEGIYNFQKSPTIGNGFQVSEEMLGIKAGLATLSAPVEKSVWISAILEEGGLIGFPLFVMFLLISISSFLKCKAYVGAAAFLVLISVNLGEFTIFSLSYTGGMLWSMVFAGLILDSFRIRREEMQRVNLGGQYDVAYI